MTMPPTEPMFDVPPVPALGQVLADPGPLPGDITLPQFLVGVQQSWHAIDPAAMAFQGGLGGCREHGPALCGAIVRIARDDLQPYRPAEPPVSLDRCPACRWTAAARTGTLHEALAELADPLASAVAAAILDRACRELLEDDERTLDDPRTIQLLAHVSRHEPVRLVDEECAEGSCDHAEGQCPGRDGCAACSLRSGSWAGEREGQFLDECTVLSPCGPLLALAAHFGIPAKGAPVTVSAGDLAEVLGDAEGFIGGKDNAAFSRLAAAAGVS
jgi:hypothetical protein